MAEAAKPVSETTPAANATEDSKKEVEQSPNLEETYDTPVIDELKFRCDWTLWEHYEAQGEQMDYANSMCKACWFNDMVSFSTAWNTIPHRDLNNIFYNNETRTVKL